ncbi:hypothetical protein OUO13_08020 [Oceanospirillaceae bacterium G-43]|mgnify:CR=1 FL=1|uniref:Uncharacterized protein n=1 Tax=Parathalassolituus penaei TaxID=2997323 RepID=A0A9X3ECL9_9GAMM|nr:hypothetical protein [Parathalassolituus penaei]
MANILTHDPVAGYLDDLLHDCVAADEDFQDMVSPWDQVLREAVARHNERSATTLQAGMAPVLAIRIGSGNRYQCYIQWLCLQRIACVLPQGRLRQDVLLAAHQCDMVQQEI